jgi:hypothetical protein
MMPASISIVVVTYDGRSLLERCLPSVLEEARAQRAEVVVVDNGSADDTVSFINTTHPDVVLVRLEHNEGFAGGCNAGVRAARGETIVLLNNDALPRPGWLSELVEPLEHPEVAVCCSVIHDERYDAAYALGTGSMSVIGHPIPRVDLDVTRPFYATGCSLAFRRSLLGEPFDPLYFAYYEDMLLSWRAHLAGFAVARAVESEVDHLGSMTARREPARMLFYWERNRLLTLLLCYETSTMLRLLPLYGFDCAARVLEDAWLVVKRPRCAAVAFRGVLMRYAASLRATGWLVAHAKLIRQRRAVIQDCRRVPDREITGRLSGKIFNDLVPTRGHRLANAISQAYCLMARIRTAESIASRQAAPPSRPDQAPMRLSARSAADAD